MGCKKIIFYNELQNYLSESLELRGSHEGYHSQQYKLDLHKKDK